MTDGNNQNPWEQNLTASATPNSHEKMQPTIIVPGTELSEDIARLVNTPPSFDDGTQIDMSPQSANKQTFQAQPLPPLVESEVVCAPSHQPAQESVPAGEHAARQHSEMGMMGQETVPLKPTIINQALNVPPQAAEESGNGWQSYGLQQPAQGMAHPQAAKQEMWSPKYAKGNISKAVQKETKEEKRGTARRRMFAGAGVSLLFTVGLLLVVFLVNAGLKMGGQFFNAWPAKSNQNPLVSINKPPEAQEGLSTPDIVAKVAPSVVSIDVYKEDTLFIEGSGSGIICSEDGYIITNAHVVEGATAIRVVLNNGKGYTAALIGQNGYNDLAVIKIKAEGLIPAEFGDSDEIIIGERVIAVGNAAGILAGSPTQGIISGVNREIQMEVSDGGTANMVLLQTDAAINPGNSGGALVNRYGQVIGINVAKLQSDAIDNIGFAIPVKIAKPVIDILMEKGEIPLSPRLAISVYPLNETSGPANNLPEYGLYLAYVGEESPLVELGIKEGDVILEAQGQKLAKTTDLTAILALHRPGDKIEMLVYIAKTGKTKAVESVLLESGA